MGVWTQRKVSVSSGVALYADNGGCRCSFTTIFSSDETHVGSPVRHHNSHQYRAFSTSPSTANGFETVLTTWTKPRYDRDDGLFFY